MLRTLLVKLAVRQYGKRFAQQCSPSYLAACAPLLSSSNIEAPSRHVLAMCGSLCCADSQADEVKQMSLERHCKLFAGVPQG